MTVETLKPAALARKRTPARTIGGRRAHRIGYLLAAPLVIWLVVTLAYPLGNMVLLSTTDTRVIGESAEFVGLQNYRDVLTSSAFWQAMQRTLLWLVGNAVLGTLLAFAAAVLMRPDGRLARAGRVWILLPWVIPTVAVAVIWQWLLNGSYGVITYLLKTAHIVSGPLNVFGDKDLALAGTTFANQWHWFPLSAVVIFGAMQTVPTALYEAARLDGANAWQLFRYITLPSIEKVLFALGLVGTLWTFNIFDMIYLTTQGGPAGATLTAPVHIYDTAFQGLRIGQAAAMSVVAIVLLAGIAGLYVKFLSPAED